MPLFLGIGLESRNLDAYAEEKRRRKKVPLMVANLAQQAIGADDNEVTLFDDKGSHKLPRASKDVVAQQLIAHVVKLYKNKKVSSKR